MSDLTQQLVPEGYQHSKAGLIPEDWDVNTFDEICRVNQGLQIAIERRKKHPTSDSKVYITVQYVNSDDEPEYIDDYSSSVCCERKDVLMTRTGNTGIVVTGETGVFHNNFFKISFNREKINSGFFVYYLRSHDCQKTILQKAGTSTIPDLNHGDFYSIHIALPSFVEQTAIANALSDVDALITSLEKLITKKSAIKTATMQQLLTGKKRLPPFDKTHTGYKQTELGEIPEDWEVKQLGELGRFKNGVNKDGDSFGFGSPFVNLMDVFGKTSINGCERFGLINSTDLDRKEYEVKSGDVLFIRSSVKPSGVGLTAVVLNDLVNTIYSGFLIRYRSNDTLDTNYKKFCFHESNFRKRIVAASSVSANTNINQDSLKQLDLAYPPTIEEQAGIADVLSDIDNDIDILEQRLNKTKQLKQGMMQELLTGRTRLV